tara:strand:+ start:937 stop:1107 length:171 start_codon:yes stop_codon:yes gene_type:complete
METLKKIPTFSIFIIILATSGQIRAEEPNYWVIGSIVLLSVMAFYSIYQKFIKKEN